MAAPKYLAQANQLIAILPDESRESFLEHCELVSVQRQDVLTKSGQVAEHTYFPLDSYVAVILNMAD